MKLEANQSFAIRSIAYTPVPAKAGVFGIMTISEQRARTSKVYTRRYLVRDLGMSGDEMGRAFRVKKSLDANESEEFYNVLISIFGPRQHKCDCKGFEAHGLCCHIEGIYALVSSGGGAGSSRSHRGREGEGTAREQSPSKANLGSRFYALGSRLWGFLRYPSIRVAWKPQNVNLRLVEPQNRHDKMAVYVLPLPYGSVQPSLAIQYGSMGGYPQWERQ